ncbi:ABC transporter substrate-binding protein [Thermococcus eurythermalis]|uniref:ABC transporter substrate-binding protein n=1 Tax=Thermococcus eurythermalis TaxID=1505907 RepID=A0A097QUX1_9EURY|nr:extracellular solute-binding protein [Thermococcus eurythermalis]AIU70277.1 ABC transporter substrate-binding protein [Thermococcus eurythermalis]
MRRALGIFLILVLGLSVVASGCINSGGSESSGTSGVTLVIVTRHDATIQYKVKQLFLKSDIAKQYNIVDLKFIGVPESLWPSYIEKGADVGWGGGPTLFDDLYKMDYLAPITDEKILGLIGKQIPEELAGMQMVRKDGSNVYWIAAALSSFGFTVNKEVLEKQGLPFPKKWEDIASPDWARDPPMYGIADPTRSTSNTRIYQIILQAFGWEEGWRIMTLIAANSKVYEASDAVRDAVINGEIAAGNTIDFYGYTAMRQNPNCEYVIPEGESIINGDPIALLKNAQHPEAAQAFIYWVLTEGQAVWMSQDINRLPINAEIFNKTITEEEAKIIFNGEYAGKTFAEARPALLKAYQISVASKGIPFDDARALKTVNSLQYYFKATLVDVNGPLHQAWMALVKAYKDGKITEEQFEKLKDELTAPIQFKDPDTGEMVTFTEEYAAKINDRIATDAGFQSQLMQEWRNAAQDKYQKVLDELKKVTG